MFHSDELDVFKGFKAEWISTEPPTIKSAAHGKRVMSVVPENVTGTVFWLELKWSKDCNHIRKNEERDRILFQVPRARQ